MRAAVMINPGCLFNVRSMRIWCFVGVLLGVSTASSALADPTDDNASRVVTGPAGTGIYRSVGANGEVEFNNFGEGEQIGVDLPAAPRRDDIERSSALVQDMLAVAQVLAADRQARTAQRENDRAVRAAAARASTQAAQPYDGYATNRNRFFPGFLRQRGANFGQPRQSGRAGAGPYRDGYRFSRRGSGVNGGYGAGVRPGNRGGAPNRTAPTIKRSF